MRLLKKIACAAWYDRISRQILRIKSKSFKSAILCPIKVCKCKNQTQQISRLGSYNTRKEGDRYTTAEIIFFKGREKNPKNHFCNLLEEF
jgi:hypothetical protein